MPTPFSINLEQFSWENWQQLSTPEAIAQEMARLKLATLEDFQKAYLHCILPGGQLNQPLARALFQVAAEQLGDEVIKRVPAGNTFLVSMADAENPPKAAAFTGKMDVSQYKAKIQLANGSVFSGDLSQLRFAFLARYTPDGQRVASGMMGGTLKTEMDLSHEPHGIITPADKLLDLLKYYRQDPNCHLRVVPYDDRRFIIIRSPLSEQEKQLAALSHNAVMKVANTMALAQRGGALALSHEHLPGRQLTGPEYDMDFWLYALPDARSLDVMAGLLGEHSPVYEAWQARYAQKGQHVDFIQHPQINVVTQVATELAPEIYNKLVAQCNANRGVCHFGFYYALEDVSATDVLPLLDTRPYCNESNKFIRYCLTAVNAAGSDVYDLLFQMMRQSLTTRFRYMTEKGRCWPDNWQQYLNPEMDDADACRLVMETIVSPWRLFSNMSREGRLQFAADTGLSYWALRDYIVRAEKYRSQLAGLEKEDYTKKINQIIAEISAEEQEQIIEDKLRHVEKMALECRDEFQESLFIKLPAARSEIKEKTPTTLSWIDILPEYMRDTSGESGANGPWLFSDQGSILRSAESAANELSITFAEILSPDLWTAFKTAVIENITRLVASGNWPRLDSEALSDPFRQLDVLSEAAFAELSLVFSFDSERLAACGFDNTIFIQKLAEERGMTDYQAKQWQQHFTAVAKTHFSHLIGDALRRGIEHQRAKIDFKDLELKPLMYCEEVCAVQLGEGEPSQAMRQPAFNPAYQVQAIASEVKRGPFSTLLEQESAAIAKYPPVVRPEAKAHPTLNPQQLAFFQRLFTEPMNNQGVFDQAQAKALMTKALAKDENVFRFNIGANCLLYGVSEEMLAPCDAKSVPSESRHAAQQCLDRIARQVWTKTVGGNHFHASAERCVAPPFASYSRADGGSEQAVNLEQLVGLQLLRQYQLYEQHDLGLAVSGLPGGAATLLQAHEFEDLQRQYANQPSMLLATCLSYSNVIWHLLPTGELILQCLDVSKADHRLMIANKTIADMTALKLLQAVRLQCASEGLLEEATTKQILIALTASDAAFRPRDFILRDVKSITDTMANYVPTEEFFAYLLQQGLTLTEKQQKQWRQRIQSAPEKLRKNGFPELFINTSQAMSMMASDISALTPKKAARDMVDEHGDKAVRNSLACVAAWRLMQAPLKGMETLHPNERLSQLAFLASWVDIAADHDSSLEMKLSQYSECHPFVALVVESNKTMIDAICRGDAEAICLQFAMLVVNQVASVDELYNKFSEQGLCCFQSLLALENLPFADAALKHFACLGNDPAQALQQSDTKIADYVRDKQAALLPHLQLALAKAKCINLLEHVKDADVEKMRPLRQNIIEAKDIKSIGELLPVNKSRVMGYFAKPDAAKQKPSLDQQIVAAHKVLRELQQASHAARP